METSMVGTQYKSMVITTMISNSTGK
jgi:hypothetical protein